MDKMLIPHYVTDEGRQFLKTIDELNETLLDKIKPPYEVWLFIVPDNEENYEQGTYIRHYWKRVGIRKDLNACVKLANKERDNFKRYNSYSAVGYEVRAYTSKEHYFILEHMGES